jgi:hypothetical protein
MINIKKLFQSNSRSIAVSKAQKEILECFLTNKNSFEHWFCFQPETKIKFKFYYPTAVDCYFDDIKLFTAYFKKNHLDQVELQEFKISEDNYRSICSPIWKPFEEVMLQFLHYLNENEKVNLFQKQKSLFEYADICKGAKSTPTSEEYPFLRNRFDHI